MFSYDKLLTLQKQQEAGNEGKTVPGGTAGAASISTTAPWMQKYSQGLSAGLGVLNSLAGTPKDYSGAAGGTAKAIDGTMNAAAQVASQFGPIGQYISMGIQANQLLSNITGKITGLDGMTNTDVIMNRIPGLGLVNGLGGKRANTFLQDKYTQSQSQFSYGGTNQQFTNAAMKSGKKYGMFSSGARKEANWEIDAAGRRQNQLKYLIKDRDIANESMAGSTDIYNTGYANELMGGYQPLMAAKQGAKINAKALSKAKRVASKMRATNKMKPVEELKQGGSFEWDISMFQHGGKSKRKYSFDEYYNIVKPKNQEEESWYNYKGFYDDDDFYPEWEQKYEEWTKLPDNEEKDLNFPHSTDKYKTDKHPTYSDKGYGWIGSDEDGWQFFVSPRQRAERSFEDYIKYWDKAEPKDILVYSPTQTYKKGDDFTKNVASHKQGGTIIPEGALHKNLNHLDEVNPDLKGEVTTKGIPIISEEGGQIVQHAEIESGEIIFQKSITEKLEELYKKYNEEGTTESEKDELAIKAGKIITCEIMKHTDDKVGLINPEEI